MMETLGELIVSLLIVAGSGFTLVGSIGLVKLPGLNPVLLGARSLRSSEA